MTPLAAETLNSFCESKEYETGGHQADKHNGGDLRWKSSNKITCDRRPQKGRLSQSFFWAVQPQGMSVTKVHFGSVNERVLGECFL